jgi:RNA polymerase sigma-70 factor (ECF subfamily)
VRDDRRLANRIAAGDAGAFAAFVDGYGPRLHRLVRRYTACEADAEDLTQEIFVDLYQGMAGFRGDATLATWAWRVALNHCRRHAGRARPIAVPYDEALGEREAEELGPAHHAARRELADQVHAALDGLSPEQRDVVILHEMQELTYRECAAILQVPEGTVKSRLSYAFRRLRGTLSGYVLSDALPEAAP